MRAIVLLALPFAVFLGAAADPSPKGFDGIYGGTLRSGGGKSSPACTDTQPLAVTVRNGTFDTDSSKAPAVKGFVNIKGFITGRLRRPDGRELPIEGRAEEIEGDMHLSAGVVDDAQGCSWTMD